MCAGGRYLNTRCCRYNCIDRHVEVAPDRVALIWEKDEPNQHERVTYRYHTCVCLCVGRGSGDVIIIRDHYNYDTL